MKDIYGTELFIQTTASDHFRINLTQSKKMKQMYKASPEHWTPCLSLNYPEAKKLFLSLHEYLKDRKMLPNLPVKKKK